MVSGLPPTADELVRWAEQYGHPEEWAKKAQAAHARAERLEAQVEKLSEMAATAIAQVDACDRYAAALRLVATMGEEYREAFRESDPNASGRFSRIAVTARMSLNPGAVDAMGSSAEKRAREMK